MQQRTLRLLIFGLLGLLMANLLVGLGPSSALAAPGFVNDNFRRIWQYSDSAVDLGLGGLGRGYTWGPVSLASLEELYKEAPGGRRLVQYFDKARMELTTNPAYPVTNGLLTVELTTGRRQEGDYTFVQKLPSLRQVVGDNNESGDNFNAPVYATFRDEVIAGPVANQVDRTGQKIETKITRAGYIYNDTTPADLSYAYFDPTSRHNIAQVFYGYMFQRGTVFDGQRFVTDHVYTINPLQFVFGLPITEAYWTRAKVAGVERDVLVQLFERRVLTYTPSNPDPYKVEMGNIGQHYYAWRYSDSLNNPDPAAGVPPNNYTQARAAYLASGSIPQGGPTYNHISFNLGGNFSSSWPVYDPVKKLAISTSEGISAIDVSNFNSPTLRWHNPGPNGFTPVTLFNGVIYAGGPGGEVYAINEDNGKIIWQFNTGQYGFDSLILADATQLYFLHRRQVYAINRADGSLRWQSDSGLNGIAVGTGPVLGTDGNIYVGGDNNRIYAIRPDGKQVSSDLWTPPTLDAQPIRYGLSYANGKLYVVTYNGTLYALNGNGSIQSQVRLTRTGTALTTPAVSDGWVYVGTDEGTVYKQDANNVASTAWSLSLGGGDYVRSGMAVVDGYLYFGAEDQKIYQVNVNDPGQKKVLATALAPFGTNPPVVNSGLVIIPSRDGVLHIIR